MRDLVQLHVGKSPGAIDVQGLYTPQKNPKVSNWLGLGEIGSQKNVRYLRASLNTQE
jgi:uncharacterized protein YfdQ (DUF2303 family)